MILITATGRDRAGMVAAISQKLSEANCNIADATMTRLSGEFAMILAIMPPPTVTPVVLAERLADLHPSHGLQIHCSDFVREEPSATPENGRYLLSVYGPDHTGLVARVAGVLAEHEVNITDLQTRIAASSALYVMIFELELPPQLEIESLNADLDAATQELGLEYSLHPIEEDTL